MKPSLTRQVDITFSESRQIECFGTFATLQLFLVRGCDTTDDDTVAAVVIVLVLVNFYVAGCSFLIWAFHSLFLHLFFPFTWYIV